jgi:hypothetical protein
MANKKESERVDNVHELQQGKAILNSISGMQEAEVLESLHVLARILLSANISEASDAQILNLSLTSKNMAA